MCAGIIQDLVERNTGKIRELHFDNRAHSLYSGPNGSPHHRIFTDRRIQHAPGKFLSQTLRRFKGAPERPADILPVDKNAFVVAQQFCLGLANSFEIRDAHSRESTRSRVEIAHQSSLSPSGGASFCAVAIASSTCATASRRHSASASASIKFRSTILCSATFKQSRANGWRLISSVT